jgi:hypothetical protein
MAKKGQRIVTNGRCALCQHPDVYRVELMLAGGASARAVTAKFNLAFAEDCTWRHWRLHVDPERKARMIAGPVKLHQLAQRATEENLSLLDHLHVIRTTLLTKFLACSQAGDSYGTSAMAGRLLETLREIGRLTGEINTTTNVVNNTLMIVNSPVFGELQKGLLEALAPYPDARLAVVAKLHDLDRRMNAGGGIGAPAPPLLEIEPAAA